MPNIKFKGFLYGALAASTYGLNPLFTLPLYADGVGADTVLFYRYGIGMLMLAFLMKLKGLSFALRREELVPLVMMGLLFAFSSLTLFLAYNHMDAGIASTILFIYPVLVAILMAVFFKEKVSVITAISILMAFTGISLLYKGEGGETLSLVGVLLVFISSLTYAIYIIGVNRSVLKDMPTMKLTFYVLLFGWSVFVVRLKFCTEIDAISEPWLWLNPVCLALFPTVISLVTMTKSIHYIGPTFAAILGALEPVTALIIGVMVFGEKLTPRIMLGIALVLIAVMLIIAGHRLLRIFRERVLHKSTETPA